MTRNAIYATFFRQGLHLLGLLLFLLILFSCEYDITDIYVDEIEDAEVEYPKVELDFSDSLIVICEKTSFSFQVSMETQLFHGIEIHLDGDTFFSTSDSIGEFSMNPTDGEHILEMFIHTSTGSGTIRNQLGGEHWEFSNSWILIMERPSDDPDDPFYQNVEFKSAGIKDDNLTLEWEPYEGYRFDYYGITTVENHNSFRVSDVNSACFTDPFYVGGKQTYYLSVVRTDNAVVPCDTVTINYTNPVSYAISDDLSNITFSWPPCNVPANFQSYAFYHGSSDSIENRAFYSNQLTDTTFTMSCDFCDKTQFVLRISAREDSNGAGEYVVNKWVEPIW